MSGNFATADAERSTGSVTTQPRVEVVVAFVEDGGHYPRAERTNPSLSYWKAIAVMAGTLRTVGKDWPITVSTNAPPTDPGVLRSLETHGVEFRSTPFRHRPPDGWFDRFTGSLYVLDALEHALALVPERTRLMIVDPDCVWVRDPQPMIDALEQDPDRLLAYEISYSPGQRALGLTIPEMGALFNEVAEQHVCDEPVYAGGEFLLGTRERLLDLLPHIEAIWTESLRRFEAGNDHRIRTEEHVLSYALARLGWEGGTANPWMRRLWTKQPPSRNVQGDEDGLVLWHALTEKDRGLQELFDDLQSGRPVLSTDGPRYRRHLARRLRVRLTPWGKLKQIVYRLVFPFTDHQREWPPEW